MAQQIELGLDTFGDIQAGPDGQVLTHAQVIRNVIDESVLADEVGVYCIGLGEHHRPDFAISSPEVLLGARGQTRPPLTNQRIFPPIESGTLKTWIGVGGSPESVVRAAHYDLPLMLAIIGGDPSRFRPFVDLYHRAFAQFGRPVREIGVHSHGYVAETDDKAREELWPDYKKMRDRIGAERGWPPMTRAQFDSEIEHGSLYVGAPETVARRIATTVKALGISRFHMKYSAGTLSHEKIMCCIELYGRKVIPLTCDMLA
ncbi:MAG: LLM class flavin-dependent oxidoreductase [Xanthobacteraceae bacterium]